MNALDQPEGEPAMMEYDSFLSGHTLSFTQQPYLRTLLENVRSPEQAVTIIVGAGVSMNAGLRSWQELIDNMVTQIKDPRLRRMATRDTSDLMRKAELVVQLVKKAYPARTESQIIRRALYPRDASANTGGGLAASIARLVAARPRRTRIITTNFDTVLEGALSQYFNSEDIRAFSLRQVPVWEKWLRDGKIGVLHVHGVVQHPGQGRSMKPVVLTESQFFKYGAKVRSEIYRNLTGACSLFVGLSMSDPNLVGPSYEMKENVADSRFALVVPGNAAGAADSTEAALYGFESAEFMKRELGLMTIFMKSYSQLEQILSDLTLAIVQPERYDPDGVGEARTLVYGERIIRALDSCYTAIGCSDSEDIPSEGTARNLSGRLFNLLHEAEGPISVLRQFANDDHSIGDTEGENFALYLWLRCRRSTHGENASYALNLVGSSAQTFREPWSAEHGVDITRETKVAAATAVFRGTPVAFNQNPGLAQPRWQGIVALPIVRQSTASSAVIRDAAADTLTVGAITLNSTQRIWRPKSVFVPKDDQRGLLVTPLGDGSLHIKAPSVKPTSDRVRYSVIADLDSSQMNDLMESIRNVAAKLLEPA